MSLKIFSNIQLTNRKLFFFFEGIITYGSLFFVEDTFVIDSLFFFIWLCQVLVAACRSPAGPFLAVLNSLAVTHGLSMQA